MKTYLTVAPRVRAIGDRNLKIWKISSQDPKGKNKYLGPGEPGAPGGEQGGQRGQPGQGHTADRQLQQGNTPTVGFGEEAGYWVREPAVAEVPGV